MNRLVAIAFFGLFFLGTMTARAGTGDKEIARAKFKEGLRYGESEKYKDAIRLFQESLDIYPTKNALFNLANAYRLNNQFVEARETFTRLKTEYARYLKQEIKDTVDGYLTELEEMVATLIIVVKPSNAAVKVDGELRLMSNDGTLLLNPGVYSIDVSAEGYASENRKVTVASGAYTTEEFRLESGLLDSGMPSVSKPSPKEQSEVSSPTEVLDPGIRVRSMLFWSGVGLSAAAGITTAVFLGLASSNAKDFFGYEERLYGGIEDQVERATALHEMNEADADARKYSLFGLGFGIATGVVTVATMTVFLVKYGKGDFMESAGIRLTPTGVVGRF